jgi:hypothetical protein
VTSEELGCVLKLEGGERDEAGLKREGEEGPSLELNGRGDCGGFGFNSDGANMPPMIRLGQGGRGGGKEGPLRSVVQGGTGQGGGRDPRSAAWNVRHMTGRGLDEMTKGEGVCQRGTSPKLAEAEEEGG